MRYTIGMVTYQRSNSIASTLESLTAQTKHPDEIIVVDDSDDDRTETTIDEFRSRFRDEGIDLEYRHRTDARSMPGGRNDIIERADGDIVCFIDDDVVCEDSWLSAIHEGYENSDVAGVCGPAIKTDSDLNPTDSRISEDKNQNAINEYGEVREISHRWIPSKPTQTEVCRGANMSFRRELLEDIGGFDTDYEGPAVFEEWDVMARLKNRGEALLYHPKATAYHFEAKEGGARSETDDSLPPSYWYAKNSLIFRRKNFPETYRRSLARLAFLGTEQLSPVWRRCVSLVGLDTSQYYWLRGYWDGVRTP